MPDELPQNLPSSPTNENLFEQEVIGSRRPSNYLIVSMVTIGGIGFLLASISSYLGQDFLPLGHPSTLIFVPQGLIMGFYGLAASLIAIYLWILISINFGAGRNSFNKGTGMLSITRRGLRKKIVVEIPLNKVKAVKLEVKEGLNPKRRISLRIQGGRDLPLSGVGKPPPLAELEQEGAGLARFLGISLEGI